MKVGIGILGGGVVGGSLARRLLVDRASIADKTGLDLELVKVAVRDLGKERLFPAEYATEDLEEVIDHPDVSLVVELMGGLEPARSLVLRALDAGKPVVTANKEMVAAEGPALFAAAAAKGVSLLFEAAVGGGIPLIRPLMESLAGERITRVLGIVNGTTNYILTAMDEGGTIYSEALAEAQRLGYAETDPTADVSGADAVSKAAILAGLAFGVWVSPAQVYREGIDRLHSVDLSFARQLGYTVKLLAAADGLSDGVVVRVHPTLVPRDHPLASIRGATNAVFVEGPAIGQLLFSGPGAGGEPTATAVLGDIIDASRELLAGTQVAPRIRFNARAVANITDLATRWYIRLEVADAPGVLASIASAFGDSGVSIASVWQEGRGDDATLILITHESPESAHRTAVERLAALDVVKQVAATIRVLLPES
ncbi:MAG TPA: homoserine dehydrogenase [Acidimicrobiia bacterium]|nr:homoserine dehydrogenase [Acidimicrobiia bacterium]